MVTFRRATTKDMDGMIDVMHTTGYIDAFLKGKSRAEIKHFFKTEFDGATFIVCYEKPFLGKKRYLGYSIFGSAKKFLHAPIEINEDYAYSLGIGIRADYRRGGMGKALKAYTMNMAKRKGFVGMYTEVNAKNEASLKLQEKTGFKEVARYKGKQRTNVLFAMKFD